MTRRASPAAKWSVPREAPVRPTQAVELFAVLWRLLQTVADTANGVNQPVGGAELLADRGDVHVDRAIRHEDVGAHRLVHELVARQHAPARADQRRKELELGERELDRLAAHDDLVPRGVDRQRSGLEHPRVARLLTRLVPA